MISNRKIKQEFSKYLKLLYNSLPNDRIRQEIDINEDGRIITKTDNESVFVIDNFHNFISRLLDVEKLSLKHMPTSKFLFISSNPTRIKVDIPINKEKTSLIKVKRKIPSTKEIYPGNNMSFPRFIKQYTNFNNKDVLTIIEKGIFDLL